MAKNDKCEFYPTDGDCVCACGSDISGDFICTKEYSKTCQWANKRRSELQECTMFKEICQDMEERITAQCDSRCASPDEVRICWLIGEVERLREIIKKEATHGD